jgi:hypothetical protein
MSEDSEVPVDQLDDERDREELRDRYYGLMQELRIVLPGVQVLVAFLLTVPFAQGFADVDDFGRALFGAALVAAILSVVAFVTPTAMHRFGDRTARGERLQTSIVMTRVGLLLLAVAMTLSLAVVSRFLYDGFVTVLLVTVVVIAVVALWIVTPLTTRRPDRD